MFEETVVSPGNTDPKASLSRARSRPRRLIATIALIAAAAPLLVGVGALAPATAAAAPVTPTTRTTPAAPVEAPLLPPGRKIFLGATDTGKIEGFKEFARTIGRYPPVVQTFHPWNNSLDKAMARWRELRARPMLHIGTALDDGREVIAPRGIALGGGDDYLIYLNQMLAENEMLTYIRPLGEPNRCLNPYAAFDCAGKSRGPKYATRWYRKAIQRIYLIVHGGLRRAQIDRRLENIGLPPLSPINLPVPAALPKAPVAVVWSPLPVGSPRAKGNFPGNFYPGNRFVDWVGTDFYSRYPHWRELTRFYNRFAAKRRKPLALTEWGVWGVDDPIFTRRLFTWVEKRPLARMLVYYQDFGSENPFRIQNFPRSAGVISRRVANGLYPQRAPLAPFPIPESGGVTPTEARRSALR